MDALKSLVQPLVGVGGGSSMVDGVKLVVLGGTVETARRMASSGWRVTHCAFSPPDVAHTTPAGITSLIVRRFAHPPVVM